MFAKTLRLFAPFMLIMLISRATFAQGDGTPYIVTGDQAINARECPRLTCSVLQSLAPDTTIRVLDMVDGDTVYQSDQWAKFEDDGVEMFVHSSLVEPSTEIALPPADDDGATTVTTADAVDTSRWLTHEGERFELLAPRGWMDVGDITSNENLMAGIADIEGESVVNWYLDLQQACVDGMYDLVLVELEGSGVIYVEHEVYEDEKDISLRFLQSLVETRSVVYLDADVISSDVLTVTDGQAVRVVYTFMPEGVDYSTGNILYAVVINENVYYLTMAMYGSEVEYYLPLFDTIVNNFDFNPSDI